MTRRTRRITREDYIRWLEPQLRDEQANWDKSYWGLVDALFSQPYRALIAMDKNRMADGLALRVDYMRLENIRPSLMPDFGPCSFLEVLIGLSYRLEFLAEGPAAGWAWHLLCNLELDRMGDPFTASKQRKTQAIMDTVIERRYDPDGTGGFFPLVWNEDDQTQIELWYQMNAYAIELHSRH
jgi:hypothetical protein